MAIKPIFIIDCRANIFLGYNIAFILLSIITAFEIHWPFGETILQLRRHQLIIIIEFLSNLDNTCMGEDFRILKFVYFVAIQLIFKEYLLLFFPHIYQFMLFKKLTNPFIFSIRRGYIILV